ncbi:hypothetical protein B5M09_006777 [Aphanomyces astaci]|uniref:G-protein coupled receptors family 3 profile domain-containing protein n=1 Tax=Aphanomyces astaci TaxID=112090 RepID=A0A425DH69_APHAT|nr:hypothetical protein B5M09_006777 [Aphanomyces astaci]
MRWAYDPGYLQAIMSNNNVPAYFCFAGDSGLQAYVVETMQNQGAITFYHYEPDMFHIDNAGKFARILWPLPDPAVVVTATGTFGELGYAPPLTFAWLLPDASNLGISSECSGGAPLPSNAVIDCDFVPFSSSAYVGIAVFTAVVLAVLAILTALVLWFRERPIIKRSQWPLLVLMLVGGFFLCATALLGGGAPTPWLCTGRPITASLGYTMVFGSLRVYLVFHQKAMKRVVITVWRALQWFLVVLGIDSCILAAWMVVDFPHPVTVTGPSTDFHGDVDTQQCSSSQFIFPALSMFWKGLVTCGGVYVAFQIRQADSDFQESAWMFASSCIVVVGGCVLLIVSYAATMPATSVFLFQAVLILLCTVAVMTLMLVPKLLKLYAVTPIEVFASRKSTASLVHLMSSKKQLKLNSQRQSSGSLQAPTSAVRVQSSGASQDLRRDATSVASVASSL